MNIELDVRHLLPAIRVPTLVIRASKDRSIPVGAGRYIAERIPDAKFAEIDTADHLPFFEKPNESSQQWRTLRQRHRSHRLQP
jgi:pimeloyl-ACP methyl ester carboxylesterase